MSSNVISNTHLGGKWLLAARVSWFLLVGVGIGLDIFGIQLHLAQWETVCSNASCQFGQLTAQQAQDLTPLGLSLPWWAVYLTFNWMLSPLVACVVGALIFWRKSDERMAFFASLMLMTFELGTAADLTNTLPLVLFLSVLYQAIGNMLLVLFIFLFPDGHFVPKWMRWIALPVVTATALSVLFHDNILLTVLLNFGLPLGALIQLYRYRYVSNVEQQQQTKWVVFGIGGALSGAAAVGLMLVAIFPTNLTSPLVALLGITAITLCLVLVPIAFGIAILHSHLFDIDILIRRTLIYSIITAMLALFYFGSVILLQQVFRTFTGAGGDLAIIVSTLAIAGLFNPLRHRVQDAIDHRFYRHKYNAQQVLARFAMTVRDEVELEKLTGELMNVVSETMQPTNVSLWLKKTDDRQPRTTNQA